MLDGLSRRALLDIIEHRLCEDASMARHYKNEGNPALFFTRGMSDEELVAILEKNGMPVTRELLEELSRTCYDCEEMEAELIVRFGPQLGVVEDNWCYCSLIVLTERWLPDWVSSDALDYHIQAGYDLLDEYPEDATFAMDEWSLAWDLVPQLARAWRSISTVSFDERYGGLTLIEDWLPEYEAQLFNLGEKDAFYEKEHLKFAREVEKTFPGYLRMSLGMWFDASGKLCYEDVDDDYFSELDEGDDDYFTEYEGDQFVTDLKNPYSVLKVGRNDPCPCGSGKKFKKCHGRPGV